MEGWTLEELFDAGDAISGLIAHPGWQIIERILDAERELLDRRLDTDRPLESRADYAAAHGRRGGLLAARQAARTVLARYTAELARQKAQHEADGPLALAAEGG